VRRIVPLGAAITAAAAGTFLATAGGSLAAKPAHRASSLPAITITMNRTSIAIAGALQSGAVDIQTTANEPNGSPTLVRLNPGVTVDQALAYAATRAAQDPNNVTRHVGSIVFQSSAPKGVSDAETTLDPGDYLALDTVNDNPAKWPHAAFTIAPATQPAALPAASATVRAIDFNFAAPRVLHRGQVVRFENDGFVVHMILAVRVKNVAAAKQLMKALRVGNDRAAQRFARGFVSFQGPVSPGGMHQQVVNASPGIYVLVCFMDTQDHREHTRLGMERMIRIAP